ncbi:MAG: hypothetical protein NT070_01475 [Cyanobacteria bacterium]|nr:hypothetical protein [Cyanobacteriota bacterium]
MNALPKFSQQPDFPRQRSLLRSPGRRASVQPSNVRVSRQYRLVAFETCLRLGVNVGLSAIALSTLVYLVPYRTAQTQKLKEVQGEVQQTEARVAQIQAEFSRNFDSSQVKAILQEQTHMVDPSQRVVIFDDRLPADIGKPDKLAQTP